MRVGGSSNAGRNSKGTTQLGSGVKKLQPAMMKPCEDVRKPRDCSGGASKSSSQEDHHIQATSLPVQHIQALCKTTLDPRFPPPLPTHTRCVSRKETGGWEWHWGEVTVYFLYPLKITLRITFY